MFLGMTFSSEPFFKKDKTSLYSTSFNLRILAATVSFSFKIASKRCSVSVTLLFRSLDSNILIFRTLSVLLLIINSSPDTCSGSSFNASSTADFSELELTPR